MRARRSSHSPAGCNSSLGVKLTLDSLEDRSVPSGSPIDFDDFAIQSYGGSQDKNAQVAILDDGATLQISKNSWKRIDLPYTVTPNTILEFDFASDARGEVHGIGFDTDNSISNNTTFQVYGTQNWGVTSGVDPYTSNPAPQHYRLRVGDHFTGQFNSLIFANDHDVSNPTARSFFSNVRVFEEVSSGSTSVNFGNYTIGRYAGSQDKSGNVTVEDNNSTLHLQGNRWKKIDLPYIVTPETVLEFDFRSPVQGEVHAIGFDNDLNISADRTFQLHGTQDFGIQDFNNYSGGTEHYVIPVGEFYTGAMRHLFFVNDHDVSNPNGEGLFSNIQIRENNNNNNNNNSVNEVHVSTRTEFINALRNAQPGTHILVEPGTYSGNIYLNEIHGTAAAPIVVKAADPSNRPVFTGGTNVIQFSDVSHLEIHDLILQNSSANGLNIDDGGSRASPTHHILLENLIIRNIGSSGNQDGIKLSGVDDFVVRNSEISRWGTYGSGIDMVGAHRGLIEGNRFVGRSIAGGNGVQAKGGSLDVVIRGNRLENAGSRAVQIGGSTGLQFFRPNSSVGYEAKDITVEQNFIIGSEAAVAFVSSDGGIVRHNTIYHPSRWVFRILNENRNPGFINTRNGVISDNIIVWGSGLSTHVNVGSATQANTFTFARNWWYNNSNPSSSRPSLPTAESNGVIGIDPRFVAPASGNLRLRADSPAHGYGVDPIWWM